MGQIQAAQGTAQTASASRYLQQLCKHWSHKAKAEFDSTQGSIVFKNGNTAKMTASPEGLRVVATVAADGDLPTWQTVIEKHLSRFAFREELVLEWGKSV